MPLSVKAYYWTHRAAYQFRADQRNVPCSFQTEDYARRWRDVVIFASFPIWDENTTSLIAFHCDLKGGIEVPPLPALSRTFLRPVAGGFVTAVVKYHDKFYFTALYGFHPDRLLKPFALVRAEVNWTYRNLVAKKQLEGFKSGLLKRTGAKNLLAEAVAALERN